MTPTTTIAPPPTDLLHVRLSHDLIDPSGGFHVARICGVLGVEPAELGRLTGRSTESVAKMFKQESVHPRDPRTRQALRELSQFVAILRAMDMEDEASRWMHTPLPSFSGKNPLEIVADGRGQELVGRLIANATGNVGS